MSKSVASALVLIFLTVSCAIADTPASAASTVGNSWAEKAPMQIARGGLGVAEVDGKIYAIGGSNATAVVVIGEVFSGGVVGTNEVYDPATGNWTLRTPMPTPREFFAIATCRNKIYCIGGLTSSGQVTGVNEVYDPATDTWETKAAMPTAASNIEANVVNDKIYILVGTVNWVYDPTNDSWSTKTPMPSTNFDFASTVFENKIYVIGNSTQIYNPETDNWTTGAPPPYPVIEVAVTSQGTHDENGVAVATIGLMAPERIYVFSNNNNPLGGTEQSNQIYDPENNSWTLGANLPSWRIEFSAAVLNDTLYVIGGLVETYPLAFTGALQYYDETPTAVNEQYTPVGYGTPDPFYVLEHFPPKISFLSPLNETYNESSLSLNFTVNKPVNWISYSLDGKLNETITGNTTLTGLSSGLHSITVYTNDTFGNMGASTISFTVAKPEPFPTVTVALFQEQWQRLWRLLVCWPTSRNASGKPNVFL